MDHIKAALKKAKLDLDRTAPRSATGRPRSLIAPPPVPAELPSWKPRGWNLDGDLLEHNRIVSHRMDDPSHVAFNLLRTRVRSVLQDRHWCSIAVTSPTQSCGKTIVALNLAFSLARGAERNVVVIDLDLRKPAVARTLGLAPPASIGAFLQGDGGPEDCFVEVSKRLVVGCTTQGILRPSELVQNGRMTELIDWVFRVLKPEAVIFDLPPMRAGDDALAFLARVDGALLVVGAGLTTVAEADAAERQIGQFDKLLGVVLNRCGKQQREYS